MGILKYVIMKYTEQKQNEEHEYDTSRDGYEEVKAADMMQDKGKETPQDDKMTCEELDGVDEQNANENDVEERNTCLDDVNGNGEGSEQNEEDSQGKGGASSRDESIENEEGANQNTVKESRDSVDQSKSGDGGQEKMADSVEKSQGGSTSNTENRQIDDEDESEETEGAQKDMVAMATNSTSDINRDDEAVDSHVPKSNNDSTKDGCSKTSQQNQDKIKKGM